MLVCTTVMATWTVIMSELTAICVKSTNMWAFRNLFQKVTFHVHMRYIICSHTLAVKNMRSSRSLYSWWFTAAAAGEIWMMDCWCSYLIINILFIWKYPHTHSLCVSHPVTSEEVFFKALLLFCSGLSHYPPPRSCYWLWTPYWFRIKLLKWNIHLATERLKYYKGEVS